jgi:hypothetical protein
MSQLTQWETVKPIVQAHHRDVHQLARPSVIVEGISYGQSALPKAHVLKQLALVLFIMLRR